MHAAVGSPAAARAVASSPAAQREAALLRMIEERQREQAEADSEALAMEQEAQEEAATQERVAALEAQWATLSQAQPRSGAAGSSASLGGAAGSSASHSAAPASLAPVAGAEPGVAQLMQQMAAWQQLQQQANTAQAEQMAALAATVEQGSAGALQRQAQAARLGGGGGQQPQAAGGTEVAHTTPQPSGAPPELRQFLVDPGPAAQLQHTAVMQHLGGANMCRALAAACGEPIAPELELAVPLDSQQAAEAALRRML